MQLISFFIWSSIIWLQMARFYISSSVSLEDILIARLEPSLYVMRVYYMFVIFNSILDPSFHTFFMKHLNF